jgi:hypothetical protein
MSDPDSLIGKTLEESNKMTSWIIRVSSEDGEEYMMTYDYRSDRLNVDLVDGKIVRFTIG